MTKSRFTNSARRSRTTAVLLASSAVSAILMPGAAMAQSADAEETVANQEILVTANRREERGQDVPVVVTAFSAESLAQQNISKPQDLYGTVPSLVSGTQGQATRDVQSFAIRGQSTGFLASPGVQLYMNEVPLPSSISLNLQGAPGMFADMENVQVLSGPQGTLFGRNTTGGAVLFTPRRPSNEVGGYIEGQLGNLNLRHIEGAVNVPIIDDVLMVRVSGVFHDRRGYTRDLVWNKWRDDEHYYAGRIGILFKPVDGVENLTTIYGSKSSNNGAGQVNLGFNTFVLQNFIQSCGTGPFQAPCSVYTDESAFAAANGPRKVRHSLDGFSKIASYGIINSTTIELSDNVNLRNIVSYQNLKDNYGIDQDGTPFQAYELSQGAPLPSGPIANFPFAPAAGYANPARPFSLPRDHLEQFTEELQIQGEALDKRLNYSFGGFYYNATPASLWGFRSIQYVPAAFTGSPFVPGSDGRSGVSNKSKALYAHATLDLGALTPSLENLRFTGGYRYTWDTIKGFASSWNIGLGTCSFGPAAPQAYGANDPAVFCNYSDTLKSSAGTWTLGLDYKPVEDLLLYAKVSRGYKSGGFNSFAVRAETQTFKPEYLTTYEGGFKSDFSLGDVPVRFNATYYYSKYRDFQRPGGDFNVVSTASGAAIFSADATIQGLELETSIRPTDGIELGGTLSYSKGDYDSYDVPNLGQPNCGPGATPGTVSLACTRFQFLTPWIYNVHASVDLPLPESFAETTLFVSYSHVSRQGVSPVPGEPGGTLEAFGLLNANLSFNNVAGTGANLSLFANNLTNELYRVSNANVFNSQGVWSSLYGEPRTYGVKLRFTFGGE